MKARNEIVAVALLTRDDIKRFGFMLSNVYRIEDAPCFDELLKALDEAEQGRPGPGPTSC